MNGRHVRLGSFTGCCSYCATRSLTAAAAELHVTQSALSHQIGKWERRSGMQLLNRRRRPLELTAAGRLLAERAEQIKTSLLIRPMP